MSRRRRLRHIGAVEQEVSLTPLIDTALTLLVIFMITTPMMNNSIKVDLPQGNAQEGGHKTQELTVTIDKNAQLFVNGAVVTKDSLGTAIKKELALLGAKDHRVWIKIDKANSCDTLIGTIDCIKTVGGVQDVAVVTQKMA